jgi:hypothetical protein
MTKAKCIFQNKEALPVIQARLYGIEAPLVEFRLVGRGKYPYACDHAKEYPNAYIYENERGGWVGSYQLELQADGSYIIV